MFSANNFDTKTESHILSIYLFSGLDTTSVSAYVQLYVRVCLYASRCISKLHFRKDEKISFIWVFTPFFTNW